jgi:large subunit ribosomal protein L18
MVKIKHNRTTRQKRQLRVRKKLFGTDKRPRLTVFRSNKFIYLQVIDDLSGKVLAIASDAGKEKKLKGSKIEKATKVAEELLESLKKKKISTLVFDRGFYKFHGRVKAVAETLKKGKIEV